MFKTTIKPEIDWNKIYLLYTQEIKVWWFEFWRNKEWEEYISEMEIRRMTLKEILEDIVRSTNRWMSKLDCSYKRNEPTEEEEQMRIEECIKRYNKEIEYLQEYKSIIEDI